MKLKPRDYQIDAAKAAVDFLLDDNEKGNGLLVLSTGCHAKGTGIIMSDGTIRNVEDIKVGDRLLGTDGYRTVLQLHRGIDTMYEITPIKGKPFVVNGGHILHLYRTKRGYNYPSHNAGIQEISVNEYIKTSRSFRHLHKLTRRNLCEFERHMVEHPLPPYLVGLLLGDGSVCNNSVSITTMRSEVEQYIYEYAQSVGLSVRKSLKNNGTNKACAYYIHGEHHSHIRYSNPVLTALRNIGMYGKTAGNKFIPEEYKLAPIEERLELLAGLLDTDAHYDVNRNSYEYCSKSYQLACDIEFLCRSLGLYAKIGKTKVVNGVEYYRICITGDLTAIPTKVAIRKGAKRQQKKSTLVTGFSIKEIGKGEYYGFTLDGNHLYCDEQFFVHHNSGKSVVIAEIADRLNTDVLIFCPSKEITQQNYKKMKMYTDDCSMYSASVGQKKISKITFATIGSAKNVKSLFEHFKYIIVDECHQCNPSTGMYKMFFEWVDRKIIGLTATPYRLETTGQKWNWKEKKMDLSEAESRLIPIVGKGQLFSKVLYNLDTEWALNKGYLAQLKYFDVRSKAMKSMTMFPNTSGSDFSERSLQWMEEHTEFYNYMVSIIKRLQHPKDGSKRNGILCFVRLVEVAEFMTTQIDSCRVVSGKTPKKEREQILEDFANRKFEVLLNVSTLTTGFDRPDLDTVLLGCPTMSLSRYYQEVGRSLRPYKGKDAWVIDLGGNIERFGEVHKIKFRQNELGEWDVYNDVRKLTNVVL
ncbi:MAG: DEAD/DEAH box helicase family protein [Prevotella sp.]|nr:DEAD/DEAH box helicase family protein [Candidatus Prevotella equi]